MQTLLELSDNLREQGKHCVGYRDQRPVMDRLKAIISSTGRSKTRFHECATHGTPCLV